MSLIASIEDNPPLTSLVLGLRTRQSQGRLQMECWAPSKNNFVKV